MTLAFFFRPAALVVLASTTACTGHLQPATGMLRGIQQPVMLSAVDRLGGGPPLRTTVVAEYEAEARASQTQSTSRSGGYETTTTTTILDNTPLAVEAVKSREGETVVNLTVEAGAHVSSFITFVGVLPDCNSVRVREDIVDREPGGAAATPRPEPSPAPAPEAAPAPVAPAPATVPTTPSAQ